MTLIKPCLNGDPPRRLPASRVFERYWKRICFTAIAGIVAGFTAGAASRTPMAYAAVHAKSNGLMQDKTAEDIASLKTRNRRLEALVAALREREGQQQRSARQR